MAEVFDRVNRTKLMQSLKGTGVDWRERRLISKLYMGQSVKVRLDEEEIRCVKTGREVRQGCCLSPILFNLYSAHFMKRVFEGFGNFKIGGRVIRTAKYADDFVVKVLRGMSVRLIGVGRRCGMEMNVEKLS
jgi:hypothetical protein